MNRVRSTHRVLCALALVMFGRVARAEGEGTEAASPEAIAIAREHFERGVKLSEEGDPKLALVEFRRSYEAVPDYRTLYNLGQLQFRLGEFADARRSFERYLSVGGVRVPDARRAVVDEALGALRLRTAYLTVKVDAAGSEVMLDGQSLGTSPLAPRALVTSGPHKLTAEKRGFVTWSKDIALAGGEEQSVDIVLSPLPVQRSVVVEERTPPVDARPPVPWIPWAATGVLAAGTVGMVFAWQSADSDLSAARARPTTRAELNDKADATEARGTIAIVLGGATLAAAGVSLYLTLTRRSPSAASRALSRAGSLSF